MRSLAFSANLLAFASASQTFNSKDYVVLPADMDWDLWKQVDSFKWDAFDFKNNQPVFDETKTFKPVPNDSTITYQNNDDKSFSYIQD